MTKLFIQPTKGRVKRGDLRLRSGSDAPEYTEGVSLEPDAWVWYFAYGSNLDPDTFLGRRRMRPRDVRVGVVAGWQLTFDLAVGPGERGVANLAPAEDAAVTGVAYQISAAQSRHLDRTEGVPRAYRRADVRVGTAAGEDLRAFTYVSERRDPARRPSRRYLGLLLKGARHHQLPPAWVEQLRGYGLAVDERDPQLELF